MNNDQHHHIQDLSTPQRMLRGAGFSDEPGAGVRLLRDEYREAPNVALPCIHVQQIGNAIHEQHRIATGTALLASLLLISSLTAPFATASPTATPSPQANPRYTIQNFTAAPDGYWTDERMAETQDEQEPGLNTRDENDSKTIQNATSFPEEKEEWPADYTWLPPETKPIIQYGIEHPRAVGKLFSTKTKDGKATDGTCTATVVTSVSDSLLITAGHCIWPENKATVSDVTFVPAYYIDSEGHAQTPVGRWNVTAAIGLDCWIYEMGSNRTNEKCDQIFLKVAPQDDGSTLQSVTGGMGLTVGGSPNRGAIDDALPELAMYGYPGRDPRYPENAQPDET